MAVKMVSIQLGSLVFQFNLEQPQCRRQSSSSEGAQEKSGGGGTNASNKKLRPFFSLQNFNVNN